MEIRDVALFGGAFNPITLGHQVGALAVASQLGMNVWFMPCFDHRFGKEMATGHERLAMCHRAVHYLNQILPNQFVASGYEISKHHNGSTYELLEMLSQDHPELKFHITIGMDNAIILMEKWKHPEKLIEKHPFIVMTRPGHEPTTAQQWFESEPHRVIEAGWYGSSTDVREHIQSGDHQQARRMVGASVWGYIEEHDLYQNGS